MSDRDKLREELARVLAVQNSANWDAANFNETPSGESPEEMRDGFLSDADAILPIIERELASTAPTTQGEGELAGLMERLNEVENYPDPLIRSRCLEAAQAIAALQAESEKHRKQGVANGMALCRERSAKDKLQAEKAVREQTPCKNCGFLPERAG